MSMHDRVEITRETPKPTPTPIKRIKATCRFTPREYISVTKPAISNYDIDISVYDSETGKPYHVYLTHPRFLEWADAINELANQIRNNN